MKKILSMILIAIISISATGCGNPVNTQKTEAENTQANEEQIENQTEDLNSENNGFQEQENDEFSEYQKYVDRALGCGLLVREFSNQIYPDEGIFLLNLINEDELSTFISDYDGIEWSYCKAEDVEKSIMSKLDISVEEIRERSVYVEEIDAYALPAGLGGAGIWTVIKDVKEKDNNFEIYYELWGIGYDSETSTEKEELEYTGKLTVTNEGKIISNSDIEYVNEEYGKLLQEN